MRRKRGEPLAALASSQDWTIEVPALFNDSSAADNRARTSYFRAVRNTGTRLKNSSMIERHASPRFAWQAKIMRNTIP